MSEWTRVRWTQARQVTRMLEWPDERAGDVEAQPDAYFKALRAGGRLYDAVQFIGQALPGYEAVAWAARAVRDMSEARELAPGEAEALKAALLWVQDPSDARRRTAFEASRAADSRAPGAMVAMAAFFSGGSMAPPDCQPVPAPKEAAGRLAAGAVLLAAAASGKFEAAVNAALDAGAAIASEGAGARR